MKSTKYLFVYGTLLPEIPGKMSKWLEKNSKIICRGFIPGYLYMVSDYAAAIYDEHAPGLIKGLIVELDDDKFCFSVLDLFEGVSKTTDIDDEYIRALKPVAGDDSIIRLSWMYLYNRSIENLQPIIHGNFREFLHSEKL